MMAMWLKEARPLWERNGRLRMFMSQGCSRIGEPPNKWCVLTFHNYELAYRLWGGERYAFGNFGDSAWLTPRSVAEVGWRTYVKEDASEAPVDLGREGQKAQALAKVNNETLCGFAGGWVPVKSSRRVVSAEEICPRCLAAQTVVCNVVAQEFDGPFHLQPTPWEAPYVRG